MDKENEVKDERDFSEFWKIRNEELAVMEEQEKEEIRQRQKQLKDYQKQQVEKKTQRVEEDFKKDLEEGSKV